VPEIHAATGIDVRNQVLLRESKLRTKSILDRIGLVEKVLNLHIFAAVSDVAKLDERIAPNPHLITETPGINVSGVEIRRETKSRIGRGQRSRINWRVCECRRSQVRITRGAEQCSDAQVAQGNTAVNRKLSAWILANAVLDDQRTFTNEGARETAAEHAGSIATKEFLSETGSEVRTPHNTDAGCEVVQVVLKRLLTDAVPTNRWDWTSNSAGAKQIACTRNVKH